MAFPQNVYDWRRAGFRYYRYSHYLKERFGRRIQKVSVDGGFTCPNVDGTVATGGCTFCDNRSFSPSRRIPRQGIRDQIDDGIRRLRSRYACNQFLAYFQPATNTYGDVHRLERLYREALAHPQIVGLAIGTRPDCLAQDTLDLLTDLARMTYVSLELGIQTIHDDSLRWMNRGHDYSVVPSCVAACSGRGIALCGHVMLGLPGEDESDMLETAEEMSRLALDSIKIHNLYVVKETPLADQYHRGEVELMSRDEYIRVLVSFLELLPPTMVIERISGESPDPYFVAPSWCLDKPGILRGLRTELESRDTYQGRLFRPITSQ